LWCHPPTPGNSLRPFIIFNLAGYLERHGFNVEISNPHEARFEDNAAYIFRAVRRFVPRFVGLTAFVTDFPQPRAFSADFHGRPHSFVAISKHDRL
jgi:hypothetical protein